MPVYAAGTGVEIFPGDFVTVWNAETPTPTATSGTAAAMSQPVALGDSAGRANGISVDLKFSGAPGAFEVDVMSASTDAVGNYSTVPGGVLNAVDATTFTLHFESPTVNDNFVALYMRSRTNSVSVTATIKRN